MTRMSAEPATITATATTIDPCTSATGAQTEAHLYAQAQAQAAAYEAAQLARAAASEASRKRAAGGLSSSSSMMEGMTHLDTSAAGATTEQEAGMVPVQVPQYGPPLHTLIYRPQEELSKRKRNPEEHHEANSSSPTPAPTTEDSRALWATLSRQTSWSHIQRSTSNGGPAEKWSTSSDVDTASSTGGAARLVKRMRIDPEHMRASSEIALGGESSAPSTSTSFAGQSDGAAAVYFTGTSAGSTSDVEGEGSRSRSISRESSARPPTIEETYAWAVAPPPLSHSPALNNTGGLLNTVAIATSHADLDRMDDDEPMASQRTARAAPHSAMQVHPEEAMADETMTGVTHHIDHQQQQQQHYMNPNEFRLILDPSVAGHPHPYAAQQFFAA